MFKLVVVFILCVISFFAYAIDPTLQWKSFETPHFYLHYSTGGETVARQVADIAENSHKKLSTTLDWTPDDKTHLVISDETDLPNGYATPFPYNRSVIFIAPPDTTNTLEDYENWLDILITHEYTHILHLDKNAGASSWLRSIFGRHFLLFPNLFQPSWLIEGLATYYETDSQSGVGRGQSSLYKMMMRMEVDHGIKPVSQVNLNLRTWPMGTTAYLYGVNFFQFLEQQYGSEAIKTLVNNYSNNIIPFMINTNSKQVLNKDITELWDEFSIWLQENYEPHINEIEKNGFIEGEIITKSGYSTKEIHALANGQTYYVRQGAFDYPALMHRNEQGYVEELTEIHREARMDVHESKGILLAQPEYCDEYNLYYDLYIFNYGNKEPVKITECGRYRSAAWSFDGVDIIAVHMDKGISQLHLLDQNGLKKEVIWEGKSNEVIGQPDWSSNRKYLSASVFRPESGWNIELFDLKNRQWIKITDDVFIDVQPQFSDSDNSIVFSSDRDGVYNIYRYEFENKKIFQLTRVKGGAFQPSQVNKKSPLYYVSYSANGTDIAKLDYAKGIKNNIEDKYKVINKIEYKQVQVTEPVDYSPWSSLAPRWWFPYLSVEENRKEFGVTTAGNDALGIHNYFLQLVYDVENQYPVGGINYSYSNRIQLGINRGTDIYVDAAGDFLRARKDDEAYFTVAFPYTQEKFRWNFLMGAFTSKTSDVRLAPSQLTAPDFEDNVIGVAVTFKNPRYYVRSISANDGRSVKVIAESSDIVNSDFSGEVYTIDWREYVPLGGQHVLAVRLLEAFGTDEPKPFVLGGEDNDFEAFDVIFNSTGGDPLFGNREYALRGYSEGRLELTGRRIQLASMEWRFPLGLVERGFMSPPVGLIQYSGSVFVDSGAAWQTGHSPDAYYTGAGAELHADVSLFYGLNLKMRVGVATGFDDVIGDKRAYFSLGTSF